MHTAAMPTTPTAIATTAMPTTGGGISGGRCRGRNSNDDDADFEFWHILLNVPDSTTAH
jgi:hypothetical protein